MFKVNSGVRGSRAPTIADTAREALRLAEERLDCGLSYVRITTPVWGALTIEKLRAAIASRPRSKTAHERLRRAAA